MLSPEEFHKFKHDFTVLCYKNELDQHISNVVPIIDEENECLYLSIAFRNEKVNQPATSSYIDEEGNIHNGQRDYLALLTTMSTTYLPDKINKRTAGHLISIVKALSKQYKLNKTNWYLHMEDENAIKPENSYMFVGQVMTVEEYKKENYPKNCQELSNKANE